MNEFIFFLVLTFLFGVGFVVLLVLGIVKRNRLWRWSILSLVLSGGCFVYVIYLGVNALIPGEESCRGMYERFYGQPKTECVEMIHCLKATLPVIDAVECMHFTMCQGELDRIIHESKNQYSVDTVTKTSFSNLCPDWYKPDLLGDTLLKYEYRINQSVRGETIYSNLTKTEAYVEYIIN